VLTNFDFILSFVYAKVLLTDTKLM